ncbi:MAG TPA: ATP-grasp domain-containing protein [Gaiellaceae bacterium]|nr:ATP-grasp domain-containing protein [Gaiellaceae bacterium]
MAALLIAGGVTPTNVALERACAAVGVRSRVLPPEVAARRVRPDELVLGRLDVLPSLDGVERGLGALARLEERGLFVLNGPAALRAAHDKLTTAQALWEAGVPHPPTVGLAPGEDGCGLEPPYVVKPRFGASGEDVFRCETREELKRTLAGLEGRAWYRRHGALVQTFVPNGGVDLGVVVAGRLVVGAAARVAAPGEWRTSTALGGRLKRLGPDRAAAALALDAVAAVGGDLMAVDLVPAGDGYVVLEVDGCLELAREHSLDSGDVYRESVLALVLAALSSATRLGAPLDAPRLAPDGS